MNGYSIPKATLGRLPQYLQYLKSLPESSGNTISEVLATYCSASVSAASDDCTSGVVSVVNGVLSVFSDECLLTYDRAVSNNIIIVSTVRIIVMAPQCLFSEDLVFILFDSLIINGNVSIYMPQTQFPYRDILSKHGFYGTIAL